MRRSIPILLLGLTPFLLTSCAKDPLDGLQKAAGKYQSCLVKRTYKDECTNLAEAMETARLTAVKIGSAPSQIEAAQALGTRAVKGAEQDSPYGDFLKRRKEVIAANLIRANEEQLREDEALAKTMKELKDNNQPLTTRQKAEMLLIQSILEEKYPSYFSEPPNGIESDPEILTLVCKEGAPAYQAQSCKRFRER